jgi:hypothetical protein
MTVPPCVTGCGRPSPDAFLCKGCAARLTRAYAELPSQLSDLEITLTRQSKAGRGDSKATKKAEQPIPFDVTASELAQAVRTALGTQIRHLCESRGIQCPTIAHTADMARWLHGNMESIRQDEAAADLYSGTLDIVAKLRSAVDNHEKRFAGPCSARVLAITMVSAVEGVITLAQEERVCGADLRLRHNAATITCRDCGAEYDTIKHLQGLLGKMHDRMELISYIDAMISAAGYVRPGTVMKWLQRDELRQKAENEHAAHTEQVPADVREFFSWREDELSRPLWRLGDFLARAKRTVEVAA